MWKLRRGLFTQVASLCVPLGVGNSPGGGGGDPPDEGDALKGWEVTADNVGLAGAGVSEDDLTAYGVGDFLVIPANTTLTLRLITAKEVHCYAAGTITFDRCKFQPTSVGNRIAFIFGYDPDVGGDTQLGNVIIKDCDIDGSLVPGGSIYATSAFRGAGTLLRNHITGLGGGITYYNSDAVTTSLIENNYVHDMRSGMYGEPPQQSHNEAATIRSFGGSDLTWRGNRLVTDTGSASGTLFIQANGSITNVTVVDNLLETFGDWCMPLEASTGGYSNMVATNNRFVPGSGAAYVTGGSGWSSWTENYLYDAGDPDGKGTVVTEP